MLLAPLAAFFIFSSPQVGGFISATRGGRDAAGAIAAVLVANLVIIAYAISAFAEPDEPTSSSVAGGDAAASGGDATPAAPAAAGTGAVRRRGGRD
jgi:hypothetical protein